MCNVPSADNFDGIFCSSALLSTDSACGEAPSTQQFVSKAIVLQEGRVLKLKGGKSRSLLAFSYSYMNSVKYNSNTSVTFVIQSLLMFAYTHTHTHTHTAM